MFEFIIALLVFFGIRHFFGGIVIPIIGTVIVLFILGATVNVDTVREEFQEFKKEHIE